MADATDKTGTVTLKIPKHPFGSEGELAYGTDELTLSPGVTPLVGCNGSGKSTLIMLVREALRERDGVEVIHHDSRRAVDDVRDAGLMGWNGCDVSDTGAIMSGSEGEGIGHALGKLMGRLGSAVTRPDGADEVWLLVDCVDSGLDALMSSELMGTLDIASDDAARRGRKLFAIVAGNAYAMAEGRECLLVPPLQRKTFDGYGDWLDAVRHMRNLRDRQLESYKKKHR